MKEKYEVLIDALEARDTECGWRSVLRDYTVVDMIAIAPEIKTGALLSLMFDCYVMSCGSNDVINKPEKATVKFTNALSNEQKAKLLIASNKQEELLHIYGKGVVLKMLEADYKSKDLIVEIFDDCPKEWDRDVLTKVEGDELIAVFMDLSYKDLFVTAMAEWQRIFFVNKATDEQFKEFWSVFPYEDKEKFKCQIPHKFRQLIA